MTTVRRNKPYILIVEDDAPLVTMLRYNLEQRGFRVEDIGDGSEALAKVTQAPPDLLLLDWMLPSISGIELCRQLRGHPATRHLPIIMLTGRAEDRDAVQGLNTGADDFITKPFSTEVLIARISALLRRSGPPPAKLRLDFYDISLEPAAHQVMRNGRILCLTPTEFQLLELFLRHPKRVLSREDILNAIWGPGIHVEFDIIKELLTAPELGTS